MDSLPTYDDLPWDLITSAIQGTLTPEEDVQFRQWLSLSPNNHQLYQQLEQIWKDGLEGYNAFRLADEDKAWNALRNAIGAAGDTLETHPAPIPQTATPMLRRWLAVAAIFVLAAAAGWWYISQNRSALHYDTALNEQRTVSLPDGTTIAISPGTHLQIARDYNAAGKGRTVILRSGEANFDVVHQEQQPFTVDMDAVSVRDIGTNFTIQRTAESIKVSVSTGKIAFTSKETGETRELSGGDSLVFYVASHRFEGSTADSQAQSLNFNNTPLTDVLSALQKTYGKNIRLEDTSFRQTRLTLNLDGESLDNSLKIISTSLNLIYTENNGSYVLKGKDSVRHK